MTKFSVINAETEISIKWFDVKEDAESYAKYLTGKHHTKFVVTEVLA